MYCVYPSLFFSLYKKNASNACGMEVLGFGDNALKQKNTCDVSNS